MAATAAELRRIYANLFADTGDRPPLSAFKEALAKIDRRQAGSRIEADEMLSALNDGEDPGLTFTQLECLRSVLSARTFAPLVPTRADGSQMSQTSQTAIDMSDPLRRLYRRLFSEPDLAHLRVLQQAVFDYDKNGTEESRLAVLTMLNELSPGGEWTDAHVGALDALLVRDIAFKQIAPFQVTGDWW
jgi:hypothetical protein